MTINDTKPREITAGQRWTFVHPTGKRVTYVLGDRTEIEEAPARIVHLVNVETGGIGWVTKHWMRRSGSARRRASPSIDADDRRALVSRQHSARPVERR